MARQTDFSNLDKVILEWEANFEKTSLAARKRAASIFLVEVADNTPQDTGETVSNWRVGIDAPPLGLIPPYFLGHKGSARNPNQVAVKSIGRTTINKLRRNQSLYIVNNSPVMGILETGYSKQAPRGNIVATAIAKALGTYRDVTSWLAPGAAFDTATGRRTF